MDGQEHILLEALKERLVIDFDSRDDDLNRILEESEAEVLRLVGSNDLTNSSVRSLVLNRARYAFNGQEEFFYENFRADIMGLSLEFYKGDNNDSSKDGEG